MCSFTALGTLCFAPFLSSKIAKTHCGCLRLTTISSVLSSMAKHITVDKSSLPQKYLVCVEKNFFFKIISERKERDRNLI